MIASLQQRNFERDKACEEQKLEIEKSSLETRNQLLEKAENLTSQTLNPEVLKIFPWSLLIIAANFGCIYFITFFFNNTFVAKILFGM